MALTVAACSGDPVDGRAEVEDTDASCVREPVPGARALAETLADTLDATLREGREALGAPAIVAAVRAPDGRTWIGADGVSRRSTPTPVDADASFGVGSITKTLVTELTLQLVDEGVFSLEDTISAWYPDVPHADRITVRSLLTHTSGVHDYTDIPLFYQALAAQQPTRLSIDDILAAAAESSPDFEPGTRWAYSNTNFFLVGRILERTTGVALETLLRERVLDPAGLVHTHLMGFEPEPACAPLATGHVGGREGLVIDGSWQWASGGLAMDVHDLLRWSVALHEGPLPSKAHRDLMRTRADALTEDGEPAPYGMGLRLADTPCGPVTGHTGSTMGFQSDLFVTEDGLHVVALQNDFLPEVSDVAQALCEAARAGLGAP